MPKRRRRAAIVARESFKGLPSKEPPPIKRSKKPVEEDTVARTIALIKKAKAATPLTRDRQERNRLASACTRAKVTSITVAHDEALKARTAIISNAFMSSEDKVAKIASVDIQLVEHNKNPLCISFFGFVESLIAELPARLPSFEGASASALFETVTPKIVWPEMITASTLQTPTASKESPEAAYARQLVTGKRRSDSNASSSNASTIIFDFSAETPDSRGCNTEDVMGSFLG